MTPTAKHACLRTASNFFQLKAKEGGLRDHSASSWGSKPVRRRRWTEMTKPITKSSGEEVYRTPSIGRVVDYFIKRGSRLADVSGFKEFYEQLSRHAHSGPGVRAHANLIEVDRLRLGPISALPDDSDFRKSVDLLKLTAETLHAMISFAYADEITAAEEDNNVPPIGPVEFG